MSDQSVNLLLITTDQQRGDCLGLDGHPVLQTPNLDHLGHSGAFFRRGYSECPSCIPARRMLMTGMSPAANGMVGYRDNIEWNPRHTLAGELSKAGYQTQMVGKLHLYPRRKRYGFDHMFLADGAGLTEHSDYIDWLLKDADVASHEDAGVTHGVSANGWVGRPHTLPEEKMHTYWCVSRSIEFLKKRDPAAPFFLNLSFVDPHPPLTPPRFYYDRYIDRQLPAPVVGDWAPKFDGPQRGLHPDASRVCLDAHAMQCARAAYFGMINFIDDQLGRLFNFMARAGLLRNTFILFTSDHGEMLGDHNLYRKTFAYEASARVPFLARAPQSMKLPSQVVCDAPVGLQDVMPTLLDVAGVPIPDTVTGRSLLPLMQGRTEGWRDVLHGEHSPCYEPNDGVQFLVSKRFKYIWYTQTGREQLFNLQNDPNELHDLALDANAQALLEPWRVRMAKVLADRPEGFSDGQRLIVGRPHGALVPTAASMVATS